MRCLDFGGIWGLTVAQQGCKVGFVVVEVIAQATSACGPG